LRRQKRWHEKSYAKDLKEQQKIAKEALTEWVDKTYGTGTTTQGTQSSGARSVQLPPADAALESHEADLQFETVQLLPAGVVPPRQDPVLKSSGADLRFEIGGSAEPDHDSALTPGPDPMTQDPKECANANLVVTQIVSGARILAGLAEAVEVELTPEEKDAAGRRLMITMKIVQPEEYQMILANNVSALTSMNPPRLPK